MEIINNWAYTLCIGAVLLTLIQGILPVKNFNSVIKLVFALYILLMLMSPIGAQEFEINFKDIPTNANLQEVDIDGLILKQAEENIKNELNTVLEDKGVLPEEINLTIKIDDKGELKPEKISFGFINELPETIIIESILNASFGYLPEYEVFKING